MALPTRKRGLRSIKVKEAVFHWRFSPGEPDSTLVIYGATTRHQSLLVHLRGWADMWLVFPLPTHNKPISVTPDFVRHAIEFSLENGWDRSSPGLAFEVEWQNEEFAIAQKHAED